MRELIRKDKKIESQKEIENLLSNGEYGVLSTSDKNSIPYGVPINYVYKNNIIYFHCAEKGHKLDNIKENQEVSFCIVGKTKILPEKFSTEYESVIIRGKAFEALEAEGKHALLYLVKKYSPEFVEKGRKRIDTQKKGPKVMGIQIEEICGKAYRHKK